MEQDPEDHCQRYVAGKIPLQLKEAKASRRRDAITDEEISLYKKAVVKEGNDWKKILSFFVKHKDLLSDHLATKYEKALQNVANKEATKSVRNRLGNIGRRTKSSPEITEIEQQHVLRENTSTAEQVIHTLRQSKAAKRKDLQDDEYEEDFDFFAQPGPSSQLSSPESEFRSNNSPEEEEEEKEAAELVPSSPLRKKQKKAKKVEGERKPKVTLENLHARADSLLTVGLETAKLHMKFLKRSAKNQGLSLSDSDSD